MSVAERSFPASPMGERKMPCGCYGELRQGNTRLTWRVTAEAFLCSQKHKQGDVVIASGPAGGRMGDDA